MIDSVPEFVHRQRGRPKPRTSSSDTATASPSARRNISADAGVRSSRRALALQERPHGQRPGGNSGSGAAPAMVSARSRPHMNPGTLPTPE